MNNSSTYFAEPDYKYLVKEIKIITPPPYNRKKNIGYALQEEGTYEYYIGSPNLTQEYNLADLY